MANSTWLTVKVKKMERGYFMNYKLINQWLREHDIILEESFTDALSLMVKKYKKTIIYIQ